MAKIIEDNSKKANSKDSVNRADYEYVRDQFFQNSTLIIAAISIYATFAYVTASFLTNKNKTE